MDNNDFLNNVMRDLKVELDDEFDRNFERKAFFDRPVGTAQSELQSVGGIDVDAHRCPPAQSA